MATDAEGVDHEVDDDSTFKVSSFAGLEDGLGWVRLAEVGST